jgi:hypothetical protein
MRSYRISTPIYFPVTLLIGHRTCVRHFAIPSFITAGNGNGEIRASHDAAIAAVAFHRLYRGGKTVFIHYQDFLRAQFNANMAALAPLVKNLNAYGGKLAFLFPCPVLNLCLLRQHKKTSSFHYASVNCHPGRECGQGEHIYCFLPQLSREF